MYFYSNITLYSSRNNYVSANLYVLTALSLHCRCCSSWFLAAKGLNLSDNTTGDGTHWFKAAWKSFTSVIHERNYVKMVPSTITILYSPLLAAPSNTLSPKPLKMVVSSTGSTSLGTSTCDRLRQWPGRSRNQCCFTSLWIDRHAVRWSQNKVSSYTEKRKCTVLWYIGIQVLRPTHSTEACRSLRWSFCQLDKFT